MTPLLRVRDLSLRYHGKPAIADVALDVPRGALTAVVGPSGCGKSSFLSCLNRLTDLVPGAAVTGSVLLDGREMLGADVDVIALRRRVGMIFQKPNPFPLSIRRNLEMPLREHGIRQPGAMEKALRDVGLWDEVKDRLDAPAGSLSGGQQQRLCIARALALKPEILLLDEPCSALDPLSSGVVEDLIRGLRSAYTLVVVTHNLAQAKRIADHVAVFWVKEEVGRLIETGPAAEVFTAPRDPLTKAYLDGVRG